METSDSECFESADEEIFQENEKPKKFHKSPIEREIPIEVEDLKNLNISDSKNVQPASNCDKGDYDNISTSEGTSKETDNSRSNDKHTKIKTSKIGVKLSQTNFKTISTPLKNSTDSGCTNENTEPFNDMLHQKENLQTTTADCLHEKEVNMWEDDDDWEPMEKQTEVTAPVTTSWMGWGNWDVTSLLNTATAGVTNLTSHVSQGLTTVLETGIGAPDPIELARQHSEATSKSEQTENTSSRNLTFGLGNFVSGVTHITKLVETTGNKVILGGLDTLETIGKKTMEVLQDGDPGFKKKRALLQLDSKKPVLSHILREAKEKAEMENKLAQKGRHERQLNYETIFDDYHGLVHLEALEMLSKQCNFKLERHLESLGGSKLIEFQETMEQIIEICELNEDEEEIADSVVTETKLSAATSEMQINIRFDGLIGTWISTEEWLDNLNEKPCTDVELHKHAISILAQLTAAALERFHKIGELLLIKDHRSTADEADSLVEITTILTTLIHNVTNRFVALLPTLPSSDKDQVNTFITNIYFESANSNSYIKNAFQLLMPVLQVGAV